MRSVKLSKLLRFLRRDLGLPSQSLRLALRHSETEESIQLPMILWHYGLISLQQLDQIFDWLDQERSPACKS
ncbi:hypothetical protein C1752_08648 [Acaryochloris thomasi RCC1774]|uniref:DUF2949 domain-containing protein n=1 Tax=Acaryochloris thomasi RCC1774 TaxID=1764569 RepID=A0A2W1JQ05_9CYAN|nr:DUF2949 domain-containing protein [Acaryochloris thomasi]PZD70987.1 hypothetical protein C1752_08648 [Acaryochloris thomasi RCC1774]